jgi:hypothetical protein
MSTATRTAVPAQQDLKPGDQYIRQQDTCTPWGLHYIAYQDTYRALPKRPTTRRTPRKLTTAG